MSTLRKPDVGNKLLKLKQELEEKRSARAELQGELKSLTSQLKEHGASSLEQAEKLVAELEVEVGRLREELEEEVSELERLLREGRE